ncbi:hypothetical protein IWX90DRAFT_301397 [Phyllosticta citrichinensis]|uniref:Secreted protein n=1 Tax=Phyllosticta citrichinensis TaxID=1130410 RepID=A0ABR1XKZ4_9PEZI
MPVAGCTQTLGVWCGWSLLILTRCCPIRSVCSAAGPPRPSLVGRLSVLCLTRLAAPGRRWGGVGDEKSRSRSPSGGFLMHVTDSGEWLLVYCAGAV